MNKRNILIFFLISLYSISYSQRAWFNKKEIIIGDRVNLSLTISENAGKDIIFPKFDKNIIPGIEIISRSGIKKTDNGYLKQTYEITSFEDSLFLFKGFKFIVDGDTLTTNPLRLKVSYFKPDSAFLAKIDTAQQFKIADIKAPKKAPVTFKEFIQRFGWYILIAVVTGILIFLTIRFLKKRKSKNKQVFAVKEKPEIPAHIKAIERINNLKIKELHKKDDLKPFYTELSNIIRLYIEERFNIPALESVTSEIINNFSKTEFSNTGLDEKLRELLSLSDTVKFAKNKPEEHENEIMFEYALSFINNTTEKIKEEKTEEKENL